MKFQSYYKMPAAQTVNENCVAHNGSLIPVPGRDIDAHLAEGRAILREAVASVPAEIAATTLPPGYEEMRWFPLPHEVAGYLRRRNGAAGEG